MRISDWSSDVCSSDLRGRFLKAAAAIISGFLAQGFSALGSDLAGFNHGFDIALGQFVQFLNDLAALFDGNFRFLIEFAVYGLKFLSGISTGNLRRIQGIINHSIRSDRKSTRLNSSHYCAS